MKEGLFAPTQRINDLADKLTCINKETKKKTTQNIYDKLLSGRSHVAVLTSWLLYSLQSRVQN